MPLGYGKALGSILNVILSLLVCWGKQVLLNTKLSFQPHRTALSVITSFCDCCHLVCTSGIISGSIWGYVGHGNNREICCTILFLIWSSAFSHTKDAS